MKTNDQPVAREGEVAQPFPPIKFKDKPGRGGIEIELDKLPAEPTRIVIQKVAGQHDKIQITVYGIPNKYDKPKNK